MYTMKKENLNINYKDLFEEDIFKKAYELIKSKPGNMTLGALGVTEETLDRISKSWIKEVIQALKDRSFKFKPSKRINITKVNGKTRLLGIPTTKDKVIQKAIQLLWEPEFEKIFLDYSHGFRPERSCHTALKEIRTWQRTTWMIEGDIKQYYNSINHQILGKILTGYIKDKNIIDLYWKLVKVGYIEQEAYKPNSLGIPILGLGSRRRNIITIIIKYIFKWIR